MNTEPPNPDRYWAFISYSTRDLAVARKLHKSLEGYRIPRDLQGQVARGAVVPPRLFPIFKDREELPLSSDLGSTIQDALQVSRFLIVLCSKSAAQSRWVGEEIRHFKALGREDRILAVILDGEPNASDNPSTVQDECFPEALRYRVNSDGQLTSERTEPIAGDLRPGKDGWTSVLLKAVAGITGLGYDAFARRERRRKRQRYALYAVLSFIALAATLWASDYTRLKLDYFANETSIWGVPTGVGELASDIRHHRNTSYRVETRRRKIRRVVRINSSGVSLDDPDDSNIAIREVEYREDGSVQQIDYRDHANRLLQRKTFSTPTETPQGRVQFVELKQEYQDAPLGLPASAGWDNSTQTQRSDITAQRIRYDSRGRTGEVLYLNPYRQNIADADGVFGQRFTYADGLLPVRVENLSFQATPQADRSGVRSLSIEYTSLGDIKTGEYLGDDGNLTPDARQIARVVENRDRFGNPVEESYYGNRGEPVFNTADFHLRKATFDDRGNLIAERFFGIDGKPVFNRQGVHRTQNRYDARGNFIESASFGIDDAPVFNLDGFQRFTQAFDDRGNITSIAFFGADGHPISNRNGVHRIENKYDARNHVVETGYFDEDDKAERVRSGYHAIRSSYDERDNVTEQAVFDTSGNPAVDESINCHAVLRTFDEHENLTAIACLDVNDTAGLVVPDTIYRMTQEFNNHGQIVAQSYFSDKGEPRTNLRLNYHRTTLAYDERGNLTEQSFFDQNGKLRSPAIARITKTYDDRGNSVGMEFFAADGRPAIDENRVHRIAQKYDERNRVIEQSYFGIGDIPVLGPEGFRTVTSVFDAQSHATEEFYFGVDGRPGSNNNGVSHEIDSYDKRGEPVARAYFGIDGKPTLSKDGFHRATSDYDERGNLVGESYFDRNDQPLTVNGYHRVASQVDALGNEIQRAYYGNNGEPVLNSDLYQKVVKHYDPHGNLSEQDYYGLDGHPVLQRRGYYRETISYNRLDEETRRDYFDTESHPTTSNEGSKVAETLFDRCDFLMGKDDSIVIVVPAVLPPGELVVYVEKNNLSFSVDKKIIAGVHYDGGEMYRRLLLGPQVGLVEYPPLTKFPDKITAVGIMHKGPPPPLHR